MNFLGHLYLASDSGSAKLGSLLADFVKGASKEEYSQGIQLEMKIHRLIDSYTDGHPINQLAKNLVVEKKKKYMNIVLDVFYDHMLAKKWDQYSNLAFSEFVKKSYRLLQENIENVPENFSILLRTMISEDWLTSYKDFDGFKKAIYRISKRLSKGSVLQECVSDVEENYLFLSSSFDEFFPQLIDFVQKQRKILSAQ